MSDSHTLIKQSMQLHGRMQAKTIKLDQNQNNRLSPIIYFDICQKLRYFFLLLNDDYGMRPIPVADGAC